MVRVNVNYPELPLSATHAACTNINSATAGTPFRTLCHGRVGPTRGKAIGSGLAWLGSAVVGLIVKSGPAVGHKTHECMNAQ